MMEGSDTEDEFEIIYSSNWEEKEIDEAKGTDKENDEDTSDEENESDEENDEENDEEDYKENEEDEPALYVSIDKISDLNGLKDHMKDYICDVIENIKTETIPEEHFYNIFSEQADKIEVYEYTEYFKQCDNWKQRFFPTEHVRMFEEVFPLVRPYLSECDIRKCRLVCHLWEKAVDITESKQSITPLFDVNKDGNQIQAFWEQQIYTALKYQTNITAPHYLAKTTDNECKCQGWKYFDKASTVKEFLRYFGDASASNPIKRNPLIGRSMVLANVDGQRFNNPFNENINLPLARTLLTFCGHHIHNFSLNDMIFGEKGNPAQMMENVLAVLRACLELLPEVKYFQISLPSKENNDRKLDGGKVYKQLAQNPLAVLASLESFKCLITQSLWPVQLHLLKSHAKTLKKINIYDHPLDLYDWRQGPNTKFPVLQEIYLSINYFITAMTILSYFKESPVTMLALEITETLNVARFELLMDLVTAQWAKSIKVLFVNVQVIDTRPIMSFQVPPKLTTLMLTGYLQTSLSFLLDDYPSKLKNLTLTFIKDSGSKWQFSKELIDLRKLLEYLSMRYRHFYESNIWELMPKLETLTLHIVDEPRPWSFSKVVVPPSSKVTRCVLTREMYEFFIQNQIVYYKQKIPVTNEDAGFGEENEHFAGKYITSSLKSNRLILCPKLWSHQRLVFHNFSEPCPYIVERDWQKRVLELETKKYDKYLYWLYLIVCIFMTVLNFVKTFTRKNRE